MKSFSRSSHQRYDTRILESSEFVFDPPPEVARAQRILIKPCAGYPLPYPATTSREILELVVDGIRRVSEADIIFLEGNHREESMHSIYRQLGYNFPRVLTLDVRECVFVEVDNPLVKPFALGTFWLPNVLLSCDYLITVAPLKLFDRGASLSVENLLSLLPVSKYRGEAEYGWGTLYELGIERVVADLYFTLPFDMGIVDASCKLVGTDDPTRGRVEEFGKVFVGEPFEADYEACLAVGVETEHLKLIETAKAALESQE